MAQPQAPPGKRRVMGRMDIGASDSSASTLTPTARPRMLRNAPGSASSSSFSTPTAASTRAAAAVSGRAKVDMSVYANSPNTMSTPAMSPPLTRNSSYTSRVHGIVSPSIGSSASAAARPSTSAGVAVRAPLNHGLSSPETRGDDQSFISMRAHKARGHNRSIDLGSHSSLPPSPSLAGRPEAPPAASSFRSPLPRAQTSTNIRASVATAPSPLVRSQARAFGLPPHAELPASRSRTPSPSNLEPGRLPERSGQALAPAYESPGGPYEAAGPSATPVSTSPRFLEAPLHEMAAPSLRRRSSLASTASSTTQRSTAMTVDVKNGSVSATVGRTHARSNSAFQRPSIPKAIMTSQSALTPTTSGSTSPRTSVPPPLLNRTSFASSAGSSYDAHAAGLRSPTSEVSNVSAAVLAEAEGARNNRKLLDLEITNKSLMAINAALEATKLKQAREIRDLKRKLREGRGMTLGPDQIAAHLAELSDDDDGEYFEDADDDAGEEDAELEAAHQRCKTLIDGMVNRARQSILSKYEYEDASLGGKVLHPIELEQRRLEAEQQQEQQDVQEGQGGHDEADGDVTTETHGDVSIVLSRVATPQLDDNGDGAVGDSEVEADQQNHLEGEHKTSEDTEGPDESRDVSETSPDGSLSLTTPEIEVDSSFISEDEDDNGGDEEEDGDEDAAGGRETDESGSGGMTRTVPLEALPLRKRAAEGNGDVSID